MSRNYLLGFVLGIVLIGLLSYRFVWSKPVALPPPAKLQVAASFYPLYYFAQQIGGDKASVINITPAGGEPHDFEPAARDIARIVGSKLLILNGGGLETWGAKIRQNIDPKQTLIVTAGEGLTTQRVMENGENVIDPHVWLAPPLAEQMVDKIEAGFAQVDPVNGPYYAANAQVLKVQLHDLDAAYQQGLAACPKKDFVTSHEAFGYLATTYHLHQVSIAGLSPDAEPSPQQLAEISQFAKKNNVKIIFFENLVSPKLSQTIATEVGAQTLVLDPIEGLTDADLRAGKNYLTKMRENLTNLRIALQCPP